jgi:hypothetical protein
MPSHISAYEVAKKSFVSKLAEVCPAPSISSLLYLIYCVVRIVGLWHQSVRGGVKLQKPRPQITFR